MPTSHFNEASQGLTQEDLNKVKQAAAIRNGELEPKSEVPTFGMQLVGINFNPSGDAKVNRAKELFAQVADLAKSDYDKEPASELKMQLYNHTIGEILNAQMNVVKLLTLKY